MSRDYYVYVLASRSRELYVGVTNDLARRLAEHRAGINSDDHAYRHEIFRLVLVERTGDVLDAIRREKQIKGWRRMRKIELIESQNPRWLDLALGPFAAAQGDTSQLRSPMHPHVTLSGAKGSDALLHYASIAPPTSAASASTPAIDPVIRCRCRSSSK